jgi:hypothetical protein
MLQSALVLRRPGDWSTMAGAYPGIKRRFNRWAAYISLGSSVLFLGCYRTEWDAWQARKRAAELKRRGELFRVPKRKIA